MKNITAIGIVSMLILSGVLMTGLLSNPVRADTFVQDNITTDTTWTTAKSPYIIVGDITIVKNATLTIEPGVTVKFSEGSSLIVEGNLSAVGTSSSDITFTSNKPHPSLGDWEDIEFDGSVNQTFVMKYCEVEYGNKSVSVQGTGRSLIEHSDFYNNSYGIYITGNSNLQIKDNIFEFNHAGIFGEGHIISNITIINNIISSNNWINQPHKAYGIYFKVSGGDGHTAIQNLNISRNTISSNGGAGIFLNATSYDSYYRTYSAISATISENNVSLNEGSGIYLFNGYTPQLAAVGTGDCIGK